MTGSAPVAPVFVQSPQYPLLMNPPNIPTYAYGIPPSPLALGGGQPYPMMAGPSGGQNLLFAGSQPQLHKMRRTESINAKIMSAVSPPPPRPHPLLSLTYA